MREIIIDEEYPTTELHEKDNSNESINNVNDTNNINMTIEGFEGQEKPKKKRGRKPKDRTYFGEEQENAVVVYVTASRKVKDATKEILKLTLKLNDEQLNELYETDGLFYLIELAKNTPIHDERIQNIVCRYQEVIDTHQKIMNDVYDNCLAQAFKKMVEAIIRGLELYIPNEDFIDTYRDTLSHLLSKADKFNCKKGKKAYSYYSNICKNYLLGKRERYQKTLVRNPSYDALELDFANDINYSTTGVDDRSRKIAEESIKQLTKRIKDMLKVPGDYGLKENEIKIGKALITLFENWDYILSMDEKNSNKLNKSVVLLFLREQTGLDTKGIRDNLKKYKKEFLLIKNFIVQ